ncbi:MAG TPA: hypothetical protein VHA75_05130, partial [Rugosimonospora sp.]|nr:hypothetical protein [Rugosimonospora sp.]
MPLDTTVPAPARPSGAARMRLPRAWAWLLRPGGDDAPDPPAGSRRPAAADRVDGIAGQVRRLSVAGAACGGAGLVASALLGLLTSDPRGLWQLAPAAAGVVAVAGLSLVALLRLAG